MQLLPLLLLLGALCLGSMEVACLAQARAALQGRLDACAVRLAVAREKSLSGVVKSNALLELSVNAVVAARAAMLVPGAGVAAAQAAEAAVRANALLARAQEAALAVAQAREARLFPCAADFYSRERAGCLATPPLLTAFRRRATLFPDVRGALAARGTGPNLARIRCGGPFRPATELEVRGDAELRREGFGDVYAR